MRAHGLVIRRVADAERLARPRQGAPRDALPDQRGRRSGPARTGRRDRPRRCCALSESGWQRRIAAEAGAFAATRRRAARDARANRRCTGDEMDRFVSSESDAGPATHRRAHRPQRPGHGRADGGARRGLEHHRADGRRRGRGGSPPRARQLASRRHHRTGTNRDGGVAGAASRSAAAIGARLGAARRREKAIRRRLGNRSGSKPRGRGARGGPHRHLRTLAGRSAVDRARLDRAGRLRLRARLRCELHDGGGRTVRRARHGRRAADGCRAGEGIVREVAALFGAVRGAAPPQLGRRAAPRG